MCAFIRYNKMRMGIASMEDKIKKTGLNAVIDVISAIFLPVVFLFTAAGVLMGGLTILTTTGALSTGSDTYLVLSAMAGSLFYFLPMLLAFTASKKFGGNPFTAVVIAGMLLFPQLHAVLELGETIRFLGLPVMGVTYNSSVIPIILAAWLLSYLERFLKKFIPEMIQGFVVPFISILVVGTVTLVVFGPLGALISGGIADGYEFAYALSPTIAGVIVGAIGQVLVIFGLGWGVVLVGMTNVDVLGYDTVMALMGPPVIAQAGAALAVMLKSKDKAFRATCATAAVSAFLGVTEPAIYGVNLPRKKPMVAVCIGGAIGSAIAGFSGVYATVFVFPSFVTLPVFLGTGFVLFVISLLVAFAVAFAATMIMKFEADKI